MSKKVVVAMSGGVDSSVTAALLKEAGYTVIGISLQIWDYAAQEENKFGSCCSLDDINDARRVAHKLDVPFYVLNMEKEFRKNVIDYFLDQYLNGSTPNPCITCNKVIKFEILRQYSLKIGAEFMATGHYASVINDGDRYFIKRGIDPKKDQSYFLFNLSQEQLKQIILPLGNMTKEEVRRLAQKFALPVAEKNESQEICFIPDNNYGKFIREQTQGKNIPEGFFFDAQGKNLGRHRGIPFYTIGQRKGLGVQSLSPLYVIKIDPRENRITLGNKDQLIRKEFTVEKVSWVYPEIAPESLLKVRIRSAHRAAPAKITPLPGDKARVIFNEPQSAITPGQAAVFYKDDLIVGGGWISHE